VSLLDRVAGPTYAVALLMVVFPVVDFITNVWPLQVDSVPWRYGAVGLFSGFLLTPFLGVVMIGALAGALEHRVVLRALGVIAVLAAVLSIAAVVLFTLDVLQLRGNVEEDARSGFDVGAVKALVKYVMSGAVALWLGVAALRASKSSRGPSREQRGDPQLLQRTTVKE
jgi:hypothetical protein